MTTRSLTQAIGLRRRSRFQHSWAALVGVVIAVAVTMLVNRIQAIRETNAVTRKAVPRAPPVRFVELPSRNEPPHEAPASSTALVGPLRMASEPPLIAEIIEQDAPPKSAGSLVTATPPPRPMLNNAITPTYAGLWAAHPSACLKRTAGNLLPMKISQNGAAAGRATCRFTRVEGNGEGWKVMARCSNNGETWTAAVRITLRGDRLTWSSERGIQTYTRCGNSASASAT